MRYLKVIVPTYPTQTNINVIQIFKTANQPTKYRFELMTFSTLETAWHLLLI